MSRKERKKKETYDSTVRYVVEYKGRKEKYSFRSEDHRDAATWRTATPFSGGSTADRYRKIREIYYP